MKALAKRMSQISPSMTVAIDTKAKGLKAAGKNVISLGAGEPDFDTPDYIKKVAISSIEDGKTKYTPPSGIFSVKEAICKKLKNENNLNYNPNQIVISSGAKHCISNVMTALIDDGDEVIIPAPYWVTYPELTKLYGGTPIFIKTGIDTDFKITPKQLKEAITTKTKMFVLNTPSNPAGSVYSAQELKEIADILAENEIYCLSDEIYEHLIYDNSIHTSIATMGKKIYDLTITINGVSKSFAMTGWRMGYIAASEEIAQAISKAQSQTTHHPANVSQYAAEAALRGNLDFVNTMKTQFIKRRDYILTELRSIENITVQTPQGAFYVFPDVSAYLGKSFNNKKIKNSADLCNYLLDEKLLAIVPGVAFGIDYCVRLSYAASMENIIEALKRFKAGLAALS